jgi:nicotinate-nucleotide adenylyltransferase
VPVFILGMDSLHELPSWKQFRSLVEEFDLIAVDRPGSPEPTGSLDPALADRLVELDERPELAAAQLRKERPGVGGRIFHLRLPPVPVSSSDVRARVERGATIDDLVPPGVARYISEHGLYTEEEVR